MINEKDKLAIDEAVEKFRSLMEGQLERAKKIKEDKDFLDCYRHLRRRWYRPCNYKRK